MGVVGIGGHFKVGHWAGNSLRIVLRMPRRRGTHRRARIAQEPHPRAEFAPHQNVVRRLVPGMGVE